MPAVVGPLSFTGAAILTRAARAAHILSAGQYFGGNDANDALAIANGCIDTWSAQRLMIFTILRQVFNLNAGQQTYQMGATAADFIVTRPPKNENFGVLTLSNPSTPLELPLDNWNKDDWASIPVKGTQGALPLGVYDDDAFPNRNINLWPIPNVSSLQLAIYSRQILAALTLAGTFSFPPAYYEALVYALAARLAIEWPGELTPAMTAMADQAMKVIKTMNSVEYLLRCDPALQNPALTAYNWQSDTPVRY